MTYRSPAACDPFDREFRTPMLPIAILLRWVSHGVRTGTKYSYLLFSSSSYDDQWVGATLCDLQLGPTVWSDRVSSHHPENPWLVEENTRTQGARTDPGLCELFLGVYDNDCPRHSVGPISKVIETGVGAGQRKLYVYCVYSIPNTDRLCCDICIFPRNSMVTSRHLLHL